MPLPLTVSCFSKIQIGFAFLVPTHPGSPGKRAVKRVCACLFHNSFAHTHTQTNGQSENIMPLAVHLYSMGRGVECQAGVYFALADRQTDRRPLVTGRRSTECEDTFMWSAQVQTSVILWEFFTRRRRAISQRQLFWAAEFCIADCFNQLLLRLR